MFPEVRCKRDGARGLEGCSLGSLRLGFNCIIQSCDMIRRHDVLSIADIIEKKAQPESLKTQPALLELACESVTVRDPAPSPASRAIGRE